MARRRGLGGGDRLALDIQGFTATGAVFTAPMFLYSIDASLSNTIATGLFTIGDSTASGDVQADGNYMEFRIPATTSGGGAMVTRNFMPPLFISKQLNIVNSTGIGSVSISYLSAS